MGNRILLLGSNGFLGKFLATSLNYDVIPISRKECDLKNSKQVSDLMYKYKPEVVINCAGNTETEVREFNTNYFLDNITIFSNLYSNKHLFGKLINFGSGAEFDRRRSIDKAKESDIFNTHPMDHYGLSKNIISKICFGTKGFYTLRLFGCLHHSDKNRIFGKLVSKKKINISDRYFDYFYIEDIIPVLTHFIENDEKIKDINLVYTKKFLLTELIIKFLEVQSLNKPIIYTNSSMNYTGSSLILDSLNFKFKGIECGLREYKI